MHQISYIANSLFQFLHLPILPVWDCVGSLYSVWIALQIACNVNNLAGLVGQGWVVTFILLGPSIPNPKWMGSLLCEANLTGRCSQ